jgi:hypothetical protein
LGYSSTLSWTSDITLIIYAHADHHKCII